MRRGCSVARADELEHGERVRHPHTEQCVEVVKITNRLSYTKVYFRDRGTHGWFSVPPHYELEEM